MARLVLSIQTPVPPADKWQDMERDFSYFCRRIADQIDKQGLSFIYDKHQEGTGLSGAHISVEFKADTDD